MKALIVTIALFCVYANASPHLKPKLVPAEHKDNGVKVVCSYPGQKIPDEFNCNAYYYCDDYVPLHTYCAPGETFSAYSFSCIPYNPSQCYNVITAPPPTTPDTIYCPFPSAIVPDPYDCAVYYLCDQYNIAQYFHCSPNLWYDPAYAGCNFIERVSCNSGYRPTPLPTAYPAPTYSGDVPVCTRPAELHGNFVDCNQYWKCNQVANPEPFKCPIDLLFDHFTNVCELAATANCRVGLFNDQ